MARLSRGAVIFLHGSGDSGPGLKAWLNAVMPSFISTLEGAGIKIIMPSAPTRRYSLFGGEQLAVWFDRKSLGPDADEDIDGLETTGHTIRYIIEQLSEEGLSLDRIVLGGFSMGGGTALYTGLIKPEGDPGCLLGLAGVFSMSSWLTTRSAVWSVLGRNLATPASPEGEVGPAARESSSDDNSAPNERAASATRSSPLLLIHGARDPMIRPEWGEATQRALVERGATASWFLEPGIGHEPGPLGLSRLLPWLLSVIPPTPPLA